MRLALADPYDVYFAFRLAFSDLPQVRIRIEDGPSPEATARGRFVARPAASTRVFLKNEVGHHLWHEPLAPSDLQGATERHPDFVKAWAMAARQAFGDRAREPLVDEVLASPGLALRQVVIA